MLFKSLYFRGFQFTALTKTSLDVSVLNESQALHGLSMNLNRHSPNRTKGSMLACVVKLPRYHGDTPRNLRVLGAHGFRLDLPARHCLGVGGRGLLSRPTIASSIDALFAGR